MSLQCIVAFSCLQSQPALRLPPAMQSAINLALHVEAVNAADRSAWRLSDPVVMLHPSLQLVASRWPVERIWRANQPDGDNGEIINLDDGDVRLLVFRRDDRVVITGSKRALMRFLRESPMARSRRRLFGPRGGSRPALTRRRLSISGSQKG
jgi:hypothetical protein